MAVTSIVDYLKSQGQDSSYSARKKLAEERGITNYSGTAAQNTQLLNMLRNSNTDTFIPFDNSQYKNKYHIAYRPYCIV